MYKTYFKQAWQLMKQNRFYSAIYIAGTGLAIALVMVIAIVYHIKTADIAPEVNRSRLLLNESGTAKKKDGSRTINYSLSYQTLKECYYSLKSPELVAASVSVGQVKRLLGDIYLSIPGSKDKYTADISGTDADYWQVFSFSFLEGKPYNTEEFESGYHKAVLTEGMARKLFGSVSEISGKSFLINDIEYVVGAIVKDISPAMTITYADLWIPFTSMPVFTRTEEYENIVGPIRAYILAHKPSDFERIRKEIEEKRKQYNTQLIDYEFTLESRPPLSQKQEAIRQIDFSSSSDEIILRYSLIICVFLLVPAINLSGLMASRMQERIPEIGIRKAFGAGWTTLINQILTENLFLTLLGGLCGLVVSYGIVLVLSNTLLMSKYSEITSAVSLSPGMLMNFMVFFYAFMICVVLNLLSSLIPVWNVSRKNIVEAIHDK
ncbi:ABC-type antimicrobial peptide transport system permease subunit [Parabacteroides sp. PF5-5]|uniref:ABC transporter permease n=1 Tax=unclassified Parabacteroides TaxID=2649774 RepID=UPI0024762BBB|nr:MULTISPECIES: ABC transporter permease [unclassified Parabacteroides]MDH6305278.1 ABC-type antimicrobial peptide transport system permease subunit [Parabacteroides sp. PH5-39]MDH6316631.1 ABC-type antimicrobial peptide transport system permease subunit [Parabacteroides sp. PF5-13]MDH6320189.1 ABC-type antimicrobial peptide transport system permease subunit [Parabacteroides sp. PH5-13]MDH6323868.1 ABC-type antimicrobial peptide transport system permease subunit [Parabacteroides sp. PH5-8]MDH